ncbi:translation initiation factor IF-2 [Buchnera aphidicola]|uniref:translation initiation factor IF-2 n=1 Tax=Buchnera aphidicola TaxID=9 RepID=UPI0034649D29
MKEINLRYLIFKMLFYQIPFLKKIFFVIISRNYSNNYKIIIIKLLCILQCSNKINSFLSSEFFVKDSISNNHVKKFLHVTKKDNEKKKLIEKNKYSNIKNIKYTNYQNKLKYYDNTKETEIPKIRLRKKKHVLYNKRGSVLQQNFTKPSNFISREIILNKTITILELSNKLSIKVSELIKRMIRMGVVVTINQVIDHETAQLVIEEMGHKVILRNDNKLEDSIINYRNIENQKYTKQTRPPIVTIMGHVDHGKTSLLDYIRSTRIALNESGGITQHIGAYHVKNNNRVITFLDTPGHAAFTSMRARGVQITDIVILVVAADDGVKPQTIEAIQHVQAANVSLIVAINKIDKLDSNPENVKKELMKHDIIPEEWGGKHVFVTISSKTGQGINDLLNAILLESELLELTTTYSGMASGVVIESFLDSSKGPIATILIKEGSLKKGDIILCGFEYGKIRLILDAFGKELQIAEPAIPVQILGLSGIPISGDIFNVVTTEKQAREVALYRKKRSREDKFLTYKTSNIENMFQDLQNESNSKLNLILKADAQGSLEAIVHTVQSLSIPSIEIKIISSNVGDITETDVSLAIASRAKIIGFNVKSNYLAKQMIQKEKVSTYYYTVIYDIIKAIKSSMKNMISPAYQVKHVGKAEVRNIFKTSKCSVIAGVMVIDGIIKRTNPVKVLRGNNIIHEGELDSLRRFKENVKEVSSGKECGIGIKKYHDICVGDIIESFENTQI